MYIEDDVIMLATVLMVVTASGIGIPMRILSYLAPFLVMGEIADR